MILQSLIIFFFSLYYLAEDWPDLLEMLLFHSLEIVVCVFRLRLNGDGDCRRPARKLCMRISVLPRSYNISGLRLRTFLPKFLVLLMYVPGRHLFVGHWLIQTSLDNFEGKGGSRGQGPKDQSSNRFHPRTNRNLFGNHHPQEDGYTHTLTHE